MTRDDVVCVFGRSTAKQEKLLPGSHIPVLAVECLGEIRPDYLVILPWYLADEIKASIAGIRSWGGQFVVAVAEVRILP